MNETKQNAEKNLEDYRERADGVLVPAHLVSPIDQERDKLVNELIVIAKSAQKSLVDFKERAFGDIASFVELSAEQYGAKIGGKKGNVTLYTFDGKYKIQFAISEKIQFDERLQAAQALIEECVTEWSEGSRDEIKVLVQDAFKTDKEGNLNHGRILGLRRLNIQDERWKNAMLAISESVQVVGSKRYIRFYERIEGTDQYAPISLDMAAI